MEGLTPLCSYCGSFSVITNGKEIYPHRSDLHHLIFYICRPCNAYVGTHRGTNKPLGRLANAELRELKKTAHEVFDPIWEYQEMTRKEAYQWLADKLGIPVSDCHIGMFDEETCEKTIKLIKAKP